MGCSGCKIYDTCGIIYLWAEGYGLRVMGRGLWAEGYGRRVMGGGSFTNRTLVSDSNKTSNSSYSFVKYCRIHRRDEPVFFEYPRAQNTF